jgi:hypothetical protein
MQNQIGAQGSDKTGADVVVTYKYAVDQGGVAYVHAPKVGWMFFKDGAFFPRCLKGPAVVEIRSINRDECHRLIHEPPETTVSVARFPKPDRSAYKPNFTKTQENEAIDWGWNEGVFSDGRPYHLECWSMDQCSFASFTLSNIGLEEVTLAEICGYLETEKAITLGEKRGLGGCHKAMRLDYAGQPTLDVTVTIGDEDDTFTEVHIGVHAYPGQNS